MARTEEGRIKSATEAYLTSIGILPAGKAVLVTPANTGWYFKPVSNGMGVHGIPDYLFHYRGRFGSIETKVPGKDPTPLQAHQIKAINTTGAVAFVVRRVEDLAWVETWRKKIDAEIKILS